MKELFEKLKAAIGSLRPNMESVELENVQTEMRRIISEMEKVGGKK